MKYIYSLIFLFSSLMLSAQIKYSVNDGAGSTINVYADGSSDTTTSTEIAPRQYIALLTHVSTGAPTVTTVLSNTLGGNTTVNWTYSSAGTYTGTLAGTSPPSLVDGKVVGEALLQVRGANPRTYTCGRASDSTVVLSALNSSLTATDPATSNTVLVKLYLYY